MVLEILGAIGTYLVFDMFFYGPVSTVAHGIAQRFSAGGGSSKKEKLREKELDLEMRRAAIAEKEADIRARELAIREKRLKLIGDALDRGESTSVVSALNDESRFELGDQPNKDRT